MDGVFAIDLGTHEPLTAAHFDAADRWLGMAIEGEPELPRRRLGSTAYAFKVGAAADLSCTGCVGADAVAPGAVVTSLNGLADDVALVGAGGVTVSASGATITIHGAGGSGGGGESVVKVVHSGNYQTIDIQDGDLIRLKEVITVTEDFNGFNRDFLRIHGGGFAGNGGQEVDLGDNSVVTGAAFTNVDLDGSDVLFENCRFEGNINFPFDATVVRSTFDGVVQSTVHRLGHVIASDIDGTTLLRVASVTLSEIDDSTLGGTALNGNIISRMADNDIDDSTVYIRRGARFTGNDVSNTHLRIVPEGGRGAMIISDNHFDDLLAGQSEVILFDVSDSSWYSLVIANNTFIVQSTDPRAIRIAGTPEGGAQLMLIQISGNNFLKGGQAISYSGGHRLAVYGNTTRDTVLGVSAGGQVQVGTNFAF